MASIDRSNKQFNLTGEGYQLFEVLRPVFESIEKNIDFLNNKKKYLEINIGIRYSYGKTVLSEFLKIFRTEYPNVKINIDLYSKLDFNKVKNGQYDIVIDDNDYISQLENVKTETICEIENCFICGNRALSEYKNVNSVSEIDTVPFIAYKPSLKAGKFKRFCYENDISFLEIVNVNESDLYYKLVQENIGIGFSNKLLLKRFLQDKSLYIINIKEDIFKDVLSIAYTKNTHTVYNFIKMLKGYINEEMKNGNMGFI